MNALRNLTGALAACVVLLVLAAPSYASIGIESFSTSSSDPQAGGHPDLSTTFTLGSPGSPEVAKTVVYDAPEGVFGNPNALTRCTAADFAQTECPVNSQAGLVTVRANYKGNPDYLLGTAPVYDLSPQAIETARFSFVVPVIGVPIAIPVSVRTGSDYGLRFVVSEITQLVPLASVDLTLWGMPGLKEHNNERFAKGTVGEPPGCVELADASCIGKPSQVSIPIKPLIDNPTTCTGAPLPATLEVWSYQDTSSSSSAQTYYPPVTGCDRETFSPVLSASLTTEEADSASGLNLGFTVPQTLGFTPSPSQAKAVTVTLPPGLTINPDAADGQSACPDADANFGSEGASACPDNAKIGTVSIGTPGARRPPCRIALHRAAQTRRPVPAVHDRRRVRHPRQAGRIVPPRPGHRPADGCLRRSAAGPVRGIRHPPFRLRPRPTRHPDCMRRL